MIQIYQYDSCPYCARVKHKINSLGLKMGVDFEYVEASWGTPGREKLVAIGGKNQVPFLVDGDVNMYESQDIIQYLEKKFSKVGI